MLKMENRAQPNGFSSSETQRAWIENELEEEMKTQPPATWASLILFVCACGVCAQGTFQNLDFENGTFIPIAGDPFGRVQFGPALPGWTGYVGSEQQTAVLHNNVYLGGGSGISLMGPDYPAQNLFHGHYFLIFQGALPDGVPPAAIAQTGVIPESAKSVRFFASEPFSLTFGGQHVPLYVLGGSIGSYFIYGGDISRFANQTGELRISGSGYLDYIQFSSQPIPEPNAVALFLLGSACWFMWRRRRRWT